MNELWMTVVAIALVGAGVMAELNLIRIFVDEWLKGRREDPRRSLRKAPQSGTVAPEALGPKLTRLAMSAALLPAAAAVAQGTESALSVQSASEAPVTRLSLGELRLSFTLQPQRDGVPPPSAQETQALTIATNRPSFNDTAGIIPIGHFQLETGYTFAFRNRDDVETLTHSAPELLGRIPLLEDRLELQLGASGYVWS